MWNFNLLLFRAELDSGSWLQLGLVHNCLCQDSLENIRLRKESPMNEKSFWSIVTWSSCCTQNFKTPICCLRDLELQFLHRDGQLYWVCTARWWRCYFAIFAMPPFFYFLESMWLRCFTDFDKTVSSYTEQLPQTKWESRNHMVWIYMEPFWTYLAYQLPLLSPLLMTAALAGHHDK